MSVLVLDATHGGLLISRALFDNNLFGDVWLWDIYHTLDDNKRSKLNGVNLIDLSFDYGWSSKFDLINYLKSNGVDFKDDNIIIVSPIHCPLNICPDYTHHSIIPVILSDFNKTLIIEVTGVKGKTSTMTMLESILNKNFLFLSSLGAKLLIDSEEIMLKENISITPASILETVDLAYGYDYNYCLFESSLGGTGLADVGLITNIVEDYSIAKNSSSASVAKSQMFNSKLTCCEFDSYITYYSNNKNVNLFSFEEKNENNIKPNLYLSDYKIGLNKSILTIKTNNLKTISGKTINKSFNVETVAPSKYQIHNVLACLCVALTSDIPINEIINGLNNYHGTKGRSSIKSKNGVNIIEEINPGLNVTAVKKAIFMGLNLDKSCIILGGEYGITCEEIDEKNLAKTIENIVYDNPNIPIILTDKLGLSIKKYLKHDLTYIESPVDSINFAISEKFLNIIFIYRSNYSNLKKR